MQYSTFYAKLTPNGSVVGTKFSISLSGITGVVSGQQTYNGSSLYFAITPKSSGNAIVTFKNDTTGDIIGTRNILVRSTTLAKPTYKLTTSATTVNEGGTVTFTLDTSDILPNTNIGYRISGVSVEDISLSSLTGNFKIGSDGISTLVITLLEDLINEGDEVLRLELVNDSTVFKEVTIVDTSINNDYGGAVTFTVGSRPLNNGGGDMFGYVFNQYTPSASFGIEINDTIVYKSNIVNVVGLWSVLDIVGLNTVVILLAVENMSVYRDTDGLIVTLTRLDTGEKYISPKLMPYSVGPEWEGSWSTWDDNLANYNLFKNIMVVGKNVKLEITPIRS